MASGDVTGMLFTTRQLLARRTAAVQARFEQVLDCMLIASLISWVLASDRLFTSDRLMIASDRL